MSKPIVAWSYSALTMFENCPRKYWAVKIKKVDDTNQFNARGDTEHAAIERYCKTGIALPEQLAGMTPMLDKLRAAPGERYYEYKMTLDANMVPCGFKDWNKAWLRVVADFLRVHGPTATYIDWKSGKVRKDVEDQIDLTALAVFQHFPEVQEMRGAMMYYRFGQLVPHTVYRADAPRLWNGFISRVKDLENAIINDQFPATPNPLCGYCPYKACPHNRAKD